MIESFLHALAERVGLKGKTATLFHEYVEHGEYGLALDEVGVGMFDGGRSPDSDELTAFRDLAESMHQDPELYIAEAKRRAKYVE